MTKLELSIDDFHPYVGQILKIEASDAVFELELVEVKALKVSREGVPPGFSLLFKDKDGKSYEQGTYQTQLEHLEEPILLFMVPVMAEGEGSYFESIFN